MLPFDSDDERSRSPVLKPINFKYTPPTSPVPFVPRRRPMTEPESSGQQSRKRNRDSRGGRRRPCQGDVVLLGYLDPNRPDIALAAGQRALFSSESASERGDDGDDDNESRMDEEEDKSTGDKFGQKPPEQRQYQTPTSSTSRVPEQGGQAAPGTDAEMPDAPSEGYHLRETSNLRESSHFQPARNESSTHVPRQNTGPAEVLRKTERVDLQPPRDAFKPRPSFSAKRKSPINLPSLPEVSESIASSPQLRQHMLTAPQSSPQALDPPSMGRMNSPGNQEQQSIPSVQTLLKVGEAQDEEVRNQQRPRTSSLSSVNSVFAANASSHTSATPGSATGAHFFAPKTSQSAASIYSFGRVSTDPTPLPQPVPNIRPLTHAPTNLAAFAMHSSSSLHNQQSSLSAPSTGSTSTAGATPGSTNDVASSHPTPSDRSTTVPLPVSPDKSTHSATSPNSASQTSNGQTLYKCPHPGCRAAPFTTPYLLNSHRNVHSSDRPYFCPRKDCPRSLPGKGFKRKNEMLRHGLVHDSPGYVCPYCSPEKEHRYPRPDNLQRHVRMHHEDVDPEDQRLRDVLGQRRTTGSGGKNTSPPRLEESSNAGGSTNAKTKAGAEAPASVTVPSFTPKGRRRKGTG